MAEAEGDIIEIDLTQLKKMKVSVLVQYLARTVHVTYCACMPKAYCGPMTTCGLQYNGVWVCFRCRS